MKMTINRQLNNRQIRQLPYTLSGFLIRKTLKMRDQSHLSCNPLTDNLLCKLKAICQIMYCIVEVGALFSRQTRTSAGHRIMQYKIRYAFSVNVYIFPIMLDYYSEKLSAERLRKVYELAPPRTRQYLRAEIDFVKTRIKGAGMVLETGCGYGRVLEPLSGCVDNIIGIDSSRSSLRMALQEHDKLSNISLFCMDASRLGFNNNSFDAVVCIQNGISAFHVDRAKLIGEALRVTRPGGQLLFSSYSEKFWDYRLRWFGIQAEHGLLGEMDYKATGDGVIVCKDGFRAETVSPDQFKQLASQFDIRPEIIEVDSSSLFCIMRK